MIQTGFSNLLLTIFVIRIDSYLLWNKFLYFIVNLLLEIDMHNLVYFVHIFINLVVITVASLKYNVYRIQHRKIDESDDKKFEDLYNTGIKVKSEFIVFHINYF